MGRSGPFTVHRSPFTVHYPPADRHEFEAVEKQGLCKFNFIR